MQHHSPNRNTVKHARLDINVLKEGLQRPGLQQRLGKLVQPVIVCQLKLMAQPPLPKKLNPVAHPAIGLGRAPNGVVNVKAKFISMVVLWPRKVHQGELLAELPCKIEARGLRAARCARCNRS